MDTDVGAAALIENLLTGLVMSVQKDPFRLECK